MNLIAKPIVKGEYWVVTDGEKKVGNVIVETNPPTNTYVTGPDGPSQTSPEALGNINNSRIAVSNNTKVHVCDTTLYINGVGKMTVSGDSRDINDSINPGFDLNVGVDNPAAGTPNWWVGSLTNFRWDNSALYTGSSLTVPTSPLTKTATTKLLMLGGGVTNPVYDATKTNNLVNHNAGWTAETPF